MRINTNIAALNSYNQLKGTQNNLSKSLERLSSGKRINGAADDAAGLAISEKMNGQVRGLGQAQRNAQDAISMNQTAEGALKESHSILQRMRELAVQSANDTNTEDDRAEIQEEVDQLAKELTRIGNTTEFNTQKLLDGTLENVFQIGSNEAQNMELDVNDMRADALGVASAEGVENEVNFTVEDATVAESSSDAISETAFSVGSNYTVSELDETVTVSASGDVTYDGDTTQEIEAEYAMTDGDGKAVAISEDGQNYIALDSATAIDELDSGDKIDNGNIDASFDLGEKVTEGSTFTVDAQDGTNSEDIDYSIEGSVQIDFEEGQELSSGEYTVTDDANVAPQIDSGSTELALLDSDGEVVAITDNAQATSGSQTWTTLEGDDLFIIDNPADDVADDSPTLTDGETIEVTGEGGIDVSSQSAADSAITTIDDAISQVSSERSKLGAVQNRLEHTINNLNTAEENLTAAESRISDVDMAEEMMGFTKNQILSQAGTAMMAQANQLPQGVLQLLG